jgi:hypothetical protein
MWWRFFRNETKKPKLPGRSRKLQIAKENVKVNKDLVTGNGRWGTPGLTGCTGDKEGKG